MERSRLSLSVVIPAYNEAGSIAKTVTSLAAALRNAQVDYEVIVVDDASADATADTAEAAGAIVVRQAVNGGYGRAVAAGFARAVDEGFTHVVTADGDGQHDPEEVGRFVRLVTEEGWELAVGIRPGSYRFVERVCAAYARRALGVHDPLCGVKGYDLRFHAAYGGFDRRRSVGTELMTYAIRHGARWTQRPVTVRERRHGGSRFYADVRANLRILRSLAALVLVR